MSTTSTPFKGTDEFTSNVGDFFDALAKRWRVLVALAVLILLGCAAIAFQMSKKEEKADQGRNALFLAEKNLADQMKKIAEAQAPAAKTVDKVATDAKTAPKTPPVDVDAVAFQRFDVDAKLGDSVKQLQAIAQDYPKSRTAYEANMLLGKLYLDHGQADHAVSWFEKSTDVAPTSLDRALAWSSVGYANEDSGKYKEAIAAFDQALNQGEGVVKGDVMMGKARSYQALKDNTQAKAMYDQIISQLPGTPYSKSAESLKARLQ